MASKFFGMLLPDYGDIDNTTGNAPGYRVYILENDGGVAIEMVPATMDPTTTRGAAVFLNVDEANDMLHSLQEAVERAREKNAPHKRRGTTS